MDDNQEGGGGSGTAGKIVGGLLKKAVTLGAGAYVSAEDTLKSTLNTVHLPKEAIKEIIDNLINSYTIKINAELSFVPKKNKSELKEEKK